MKKLDKKTAIKIAYLTGGLATATHFVVRGMIPSFKKSNDKCSSVLASVVAIAGTTMTWPVYIAGLIYTIKKDKSTK